MTKQARKKEATMINNNARKTEIANLKVWLESLTLEYNSLAARTEKIEHWIKQKGKK